MLEIMNEVIGLLKKNGFKGTGRNKYSNNKCTVIIRPSGGYDICDIKGNTMHSYSYNIYWLIGVLTYNGYMDKNYIQ